MAVQVQTRRGTTAEHSSFTGANGEVTVDTDKEVVVVHDGATAGGYPLMRENGSNSALALGSAGTPSLKFTGDTNTGIYSPGADQVAISTNGAQRVTIDSTGKCLVGTSTARANFYNSSSVTTPQLQVEGTDYSTSSFSMVCNNTGTTTFPMLVLAKSAGASIGSNTAVSNGHILGQITFQGNDGTEFVDSANITAVVDGTSGADDLPSRLVFSTTADGASSPTERMRITNDGAILFGTTNADPVANNVNGVAIGSDSIIRCAVSGNPAAAFSRRTSDGSVINFHRGSATIVGTISVTTTATAYNTSSDYRLKENVTAVVDGISRLQQLKPSRFNFIADPDKTVDGFLAHEVQEVVPEAITGEKDAVNDDGNPVYQGIDQSKLVPLLTAALQEAIGRIEALEAEVAALKAQ